MNQKVRKLLFLTCILLIQGVYAQTTVTGTITDANDGSALPGVSVIIKGTTKGGSTDFDGKYSIQVSDSSAILVFSSLGYKTQEIVVGDRTIIDIAMEEDAAKLDEVVVTALGIKREKKALGYAIQEVKGPEIVAAKENNLTNALSGKIAGLQVIRGSNGPASSAKLILRGFNSLSPRNEPLIVVDGIPVDNFQGGEAGFFNPTQDRGNGLGDLNPDTIESISVLKGASAAALYGSRAGNGVILITTKTGKKTAGLGITYTGSLGIQTLANRVEIQDTFGQGVNGDPAADPTTENNSWGPRIEGQLVENYAGVQAPLRFYDNVDSFLKTGVSQTHSLSFQQQVSEATSMFSSVRYLEDKSMTENADYQRLNFLTRAVSNFGKDKRWTTDVKVEYINSIAKNRPINGENTSNYFRTVFSMPTTINVRDFENTTDEFGNVRWWTTSNSVNPYWAVDNNNNEDNRNRFLLNGALKYQFTDWLNAEIRLGADIYNTFEENKLNAGSALGETGRYSVREDSFIEKNYSFLVTAQKENVFGKLGGTVNIGGNLFASTYNRINLNAGALDVPNFFSLNNGVNPAEIREFFQDKKINSLYGTVQLDYDGYAFVEFTARNDWSSALIEENRSFFYPSITGSLVVTDMIAKNGGNLPSWLTFAKLRGSYATVGNDLPPFQLNNFFQIGKDPNGNTVASINGILLDPTIESELIKSTEFGAEARFFNNRLALDFTWYKTNATNQIIDIPLDPFSGFSAFKANAGDIQNKGIELSLNATILDNPDGLSWQANLNYAKNENTIEELIDDIDFISLGEFDKFSVRANAGGNYGDLHGTRFLRVQDETSPHFGRIIVGANGVPENDNQNQTEILGNQQPDALLGFTNTFKYKNVSLSFLIDARIGGEIFSGTNRSTQLAGTAAATVVNGAREDFVFNGVVDDGNGGFVENTTEVSPQLFYTTN